jgi:GDPmannose 4,6-dehydratase
MKIALITGITGQDGHHLTKLLLGNNYTVHGLVNGQRNSRVNSYQLLFPEVVLHYGDLADMSSLMSILAKVKPDEIYNLGAISFVSMSFEQPELTSNITGLGPLRLLEAVRKLGMEKDCRYYQASSSEMFGKVHETPQNESTLFHPRSPYGAAKVFAHFITQNYREAYGIHASSGILFNHEGEFRGYEFVTRKITSTIAKIKYGKADEIRLGNISPKRDWGYAGDYVDAMHRMVTHEIPDDYVIATGETHSVEEFLDLAFNIAEIPNGKELYLKRDKSFDRPSEVDLLIGDASKAKRVLGWEPTVRFEALVELMMLNDLRLESNQD